LLIIIPFINKKNEGIAHSKYVILQFQAMNDSIIRYQYNPMLTDTAGFFDYCIPLSNESSLTVVDSLKKYYDFNQYNFVTPTEQANKVLLTNSIFKPHSLKPTHSDPLSINRQSTDWITVIFLACLLIFAWIQSSYSKRFNQIFRAAAQPHFVNQLEREGNLFKERITIGLGFIYYTTFSIFVFQLYRTFFTIPFGLSNLAFAGIIFAGLFLFQLLKSLAVISSGVIFNTRESARSYQLNTLIFNYITGILLFPVTLIAIYWNSTVFLIVGILIASFLISYCFIRGFLTGLSNKNYSLFYLFLYLCTLEILPLLLIYKAISSM
jgi:hypothetical protein